MRAAWLAAIVVVTACEHEPELAPVPLSALGGALADALCAWSVRCLHVPDDATCRRLLDPKQLDTRRAEDAVAAGRLIYDGGAAARCVALTEAASCPSAPFSDPACAAMFAGAMQAGDPCTSDFECIDAACEMPACDVQCCVGTCGEPGPTLPDPPPRQSVGAPCDTHTDCVVEAYCETDGRCTALPDAPGQRCLFGCARGDLFCDVDALVCRAYAGRGESCDADHPCDPAWAVCDDVCIDRPGAGEPCGEPAACVARTFCDPEGVCRARGEAGAPCTGHDECAVACDLTQNVCVDYRSCTIPAWVGFDLAFAFW